MCLCPTYGSLCLSCSHAGGHVWVQLAVGPLWVPCIAHDVVAFSNSLLEAHQTAWGACVDFTVPPDYNITAWGACVYLLSLGLVASNCGHLCALVVRGNRAAYKSCPGFASLALAAHSPKQ